jgi:hypothetical protein
VSLFHRHKWEEVSRTFNPPTGVAPTPRIEGSGASASSLAWEYTNMLRRAIEGSIVVELRCKTCGEIDFTRCFGRSDGSPESTESAAGSSQ